MVSCNIVQDHDAASSQLVYPCAHRDNSKVDNFHGNSIENPYAWLEDPDADDTKDFVRQQNTISEPIIHGHPVREKFKTRLTELWDYPKYGTPFRKGEKENSKYFYYYNSGLQNQSVLYVQSSLTSEADVFLDPNSFDDNGLKSISGMSFTEDGSLCCYGVSDKGSDWVSIKFMDVATKQHKSDVLENVKFSCMTWTHDNKGIFYNKYPKDNENKQDGTETTTNLNQKLYYHVIGESQDKDLLVAEFPENPKWMVHASMCDDGRYVLLNISEGCAPVNRLYVCDLHAIHNKITGILPYKKVVDNFDAEYDFIANDGDRFVFKTNNDAPRYKLITIDMKTFALAPLIEEHERDVLEWSACVNGSTLVLCYLKDVKNKLFLHHFATGVRYKELPLDIGSVIGYSGDKKDTEMFYKFDGFLSPGLVYHLDFTKDIAESKVFRETKVKGFDASLFETKQLFYKSKDGTDIPMFVIHKKGISLDGSHPCLLYGYGGFSISITPSFSVSRTMFIQNLGGVLAIANIRGGGEYGETWHKDGCFDKKQNVFDDFIAAGEYLITEKFTNSERLAINGGSNGGLLVTACMNQRPDLFKCVVAQVGVCDMLNFHKYTIGHAWTTDFGCSDKKIDFDYLFKYSPVHNVHVSTHQYPAVLLLTADHDDRVVPLHSLKMIATLQHVLGKDEKQMNPLLIKIDTESGHGGGKPTSKRIEEAADMYSFISKMVKASWLD